MNEQVASALFCLIILIPIGVFARQIQKVRRGTRPKFSAALPFFSYSVLPLLVYALVFLVLVGVEEITNVGMITEAMARSLPFVIGVGLAEVLLLTVTFAIALCFLRSPEDAA